MSKKILTDDLLDAVTDRAWAAVVEDAAKRGVEPARTRAEVRAAIAWNLIRHDGYRLLDVPKE